jgi:excisionase family DNA binding protein
LRACRPAFRCSATKIPFRLKSVPGCKPAPGAPAYKFFAEQRISFRTGLDANVAEGEAYFTFVGLPEQIRPATKTGRFSLLATQVLQTQQKTAEMYRDRLFSISEARVALGGLHASTIRKYIKSGLLKAIRVGRLGHYRIPASELRRLRGEEQNK